MEVNSASVKQLRSRAREFLSFRQHPIKIIKYTAKYLCCCCCHWENI